MATRRTRRERTEQYNTRDYIEGILKPTKAMRKYSPVQRQQIITRNTRVFVAGSHMTQATLRRMWHIPALNIEGLTLNGTARMVKNHQFALLSAYTDFNKLLTRRGLVIRQAGNIYNICDSDGARGRVAGLLHESDVKDRAASRLASGIRRYNCGWSTLSGAELERSN